MVPGKKTKENRKQSLPLYFLRGKPPSPKFARIGSFLTLKPRFGGHFSVTPLETAAEDKAEGLERGTEGSWEENRLAAPRKELTTGLNGKPASPLLRYSRQSIFSERSGYANSFNYVRWGGGYDTEREITPRVLETKRTASSSGFPSSSSSLAEMLRFSLTFMSTEPGRWGGLF